MNGKGIIERIAMAPAWVLSLLGAVLAAFALAFLNNYIDEPLSYVIWSLMNATASLLICIVHSTRAWVVPLLCNILALLPAACDDSFWNTSFGIIIAAGVVLSFIVAHLGALLGRRIGHQRQHD